MEGMTMKFSSLFFAAGLTVAPLFDPGGASMAQTGTSLGVTPTTLPGVLVEKPESRGRPHRPDPRAAAHTTASLRSSIASGDSAPVYGRVTLATTTGNCSTTTWPIVSAVQCTKPMAHNYVECTEMLAKSGARSTDSWWWCSNQGFKN